MTEHDRAQETSLALHREVARRLREDPRLVERARVRVAAWTGVHVRYQDAWARALDGPFEELCALLVDTGERARDLRQASPFAGVLDAPTRWRIWREVRGQ